MAGIVVLATALSSGQAAATAKTSRVTLYEIDVATGTVSGAGTDADVAVEFWGTLKGKRIRSGALELENRNHDDFEAGRTDRFNYNLNELGTITHVCVIRNDAGLGDEWYVDDIAIRDVRANVKYIAPYHQWLPVSQRVCKAASPR